MLPKLNEEQLVRAFQCSTLWLCSFWEVNPEIEQTATVQSPRTANPSAREFETSDLGSDNLAEPLTNSANQPGDGEKRPPVTAAGAHIWPARANTETNGERENARNADQLGLAETATPSTNCGENVAGKGIGSSSQTKGISRAGDADKVIDTKWATQTRRLP